MGWQHFNKAKGTQWGLTSAYHLHSQGSRHLPGLILGLYFLLSCTVSWKDRLKYTDLTPAYENALFLLRINTFEPSHKATTARHHAPSSAVFVCLSWATHVFRHTLPKFSTNVWLRSCQGVQLEKQAGVYSRVLLCGAIGTRLVADSHGGSCGWSPSSQRVYGFHQREMCYVCGLRVW